MQQDAVLRFSYPHKVVGLMVPGVEMGGPMTATLTFDYPEGAAFDLAEAIRAAIAEEEAPFIFDEDMPSRPTGSTTAIGDLVPNLLYTRPAYLRSTDNRATFTTLPDGMDIGELVEYAGVILMRAVQIGTGFEEPESEVFTELALHAERRDLLPPSKRTMLLWSIRTWRVRRRRTAMQGPRVVSSSDPNAVWHFASDYDAVPGKTSEAGSHLDGDSEEGQMEPEEED